ncbi:flagellar hook-basal body complex protein FliE [Treponema sp. OMZ 840]
MVFLAGKSTVSAFESNPGKANRTAFDRYLLDAVQYVNQKQIDVTDMEQQLVTDPDSVDPHDVTIAMAKANLSLSIAQNVISRLTQAWNEITSNR